MRGLVRKEGQGRRKTIEGSLGFFFENPKQGEKLLPIKRENSQ